MNTTITIEKLVDTIIDHSGITFFSDKSSDVDAFLLKNFKIITTYTNTIIVNDQI